MIKYLEVADFHFSKRWAETSISAAQKVAEAAKKQNVDFIAIVGDFFDSPIYASDKGGMQIAKRIVKSWLDVCPVVAVEGTPSHDAPGCYGLFEDMGLRLLKPGNVYGYGSGAVIQLGDDARGVKCILFGVPELNKNTIQAQLSLSGEEANAEVLNLFSRYVKEFIAPMRMKYSDIPAIGLLHGNVSDSHRNNETDIILKSSDIVIYTEDLEPAKLDRWSLAHIHTPWESEKICAGYAGFMGIDSNPWGKTGFVPAMNMIEIGKPITRIPYGTPERRKITCLGDIEIGDNIAYWFEADDPDITLPEGLHPWSRKTYNEQTIETRRVTEEEIRNVKSLWDLFILIDEKVPKKLKSKVDLITETIKHAAPEKINVALKSVKIQGCILFDKGLTSIELDIAKLPEGLNLITGDNGAGKSSLLSFCHPYPMIIGKDKGSTLKKYFNQKDSMIEKTLIVNGQIHKHIITIKAAHTNTPKTECYLTIDNEPQLDKATFDEMLEACERLYGPALDYRITTFCEQPQQATSNMSGLMSAKPIDARNIVQTIAGVDREQEKRFALDKVQEIEKEQERTNIKIDTLYESLPEDDSENQKIKQDLETEIAQTVNKKSETERSGKDQAAAVAKLEAEKAENDKAQIDATHLNTKVVELDTSIAGRKRSISEQEKLVSTLSENRELIAKDKLAIKRVEEIKNIEHEIADLKFTYMDLNSQYQTLYNVVKAKQDKYNREIEIAQREIKSIDKQIELHNEPCEFCERLSSSAEEKIGILRHDRDNKLTIIELSDPLLKALKWPIVPLEPMYKTVSVKPSVLSDFETSSILDDIKNAENAEAEIGRIKTQISAFETEVKKALAEFSAIIIDKEIDSKVSDAKNRLDYLRSEHSDLKTREATLMGRLTNITEKIATVAAQRAEIKDLEHSLNSKDLDDWKYIAKMLGSDKIPALELEMVLSSIDAEATRNIEPFLEGRFSFRTLTQEQGKKSKIDRFDILVHDLETGDEMSLFYYNPGHKAFFSDAYIKSLIRQRNNRIDRSYSPIIFDESDAPIKEHRIPMYYDINQKYFKKDNSTVLIVSQKDSAENYMENVINIETLKEV